MPDEKLEVAQGRQNGVLLSAQVRVHSHGIINYYCVQCSHPLSVLVIFALLAVIHCI